MHFADIGTRKPILLLKILKMYDSESFAEFLDKKIYSMYYKVDVVHVHIFKSNYAFQDSHT